MRGNWIRGRTNRDVIRLGGKTRLKEPQRLILWSIFEKVRTALKSQELITDSGRFNVLASRYRSGVSSPFDFAVVDEAQDISIAQLRFLSALGGGRTNGLFFVGDLGQRIFQQPFSWKALGVDVRGRSTTLKINYRTSQSDSLSGRPLARGGSVRRRRQLRRTQGNDFSIRRSKTRHSSVANRQSRNQGRGPMDCGPHKDRNSAARDCDLRSIRSRVGPGQSRGKRRRSEFRCS